ncbi:hypothetical protein [Rhodococcus sp. NPDC004095]
MTNTTARLLATAPIALIILTACSNNSYSTPEGPSAVAANATTTARRTSTQATTKPPAAPKPTPATKPSTLPLPDPAKLDGINYADPELDPDKVLDDFLRIDGPLPDQLRAKGLSDDDVLAVTVYQSMACEAIQASPDLKSAFDPATVRADMTSNYNITIDLQTAQSIIAAC